MRVQCDISHEVTIKPKKYILQLEVESDPWDSAVEEHE